MLKKERKIKGINPAVITPFTREGKLDEDGLRVNIKFLIESGVHGLVVNGCTGEAASLSPEERKRVVRVAVSEVKGKDVPIIAGTGATNTEDTIKLTNDAKEAGAYAALIVTPFFSIPNEKGLIKHYKAVGEKVGLPIILYNIPQLTNVNLNPTITVKLHEEVQSIVGIKDSSGNISQFSETVRLLGKKISVLTGGDDLLLPAFSLGASGAIIALGNIAPKMTVDLFNLMQKGDLNKARDIYYKLLPIARAIGGENNFPAQVKEAVNMLGRPAGLCRSPIVPLEEQEKKKIVQALKHAGLLG
jgi:4-hydroxy-tetrahydrodipicolinate synthase